MTDERRTTRRITVEREPYNAEVPLGETALAPGEGCLFVRSHFAVPALDARTHRVEVAGEVARPLALSVADLARFPRQRLDVTLECAGNGRKLVTPSPPGTPWGLGATGSAVFEGASLHDLLEEAGASGEAVEVLARGVDAGKVASGDTVPFERSLPLAVARRGGVIVADAMNGAPLPPEHGHPLRLVVPGWYGVASVKWLARLEVLRTPFTGWFQKATYVYDGQEGLADGTPVGPMRVRALLTWPEPGAELPGGAVPVHGVAWSGGVRVTAVALSDDEGASWTQMSLGEDGGPWVRRPWSGTWTPRGPGSYTLLVRATDASGAAQPLRPVWNRFGYGNNAVQRVPVTVLRSM